MTPWRDGWRVKDPARPCYTCGAPPLGTQAGQPYYPATCRHEPITPDPTTLDFREYGVVKIVLSDDELGRATDRAEHIVDTDVGRGWSMKFDPGGETRLEVNVRGFAAELAAHRATGLPLHWGLLDKGYRRREKVPDLGTRTEVRNARRHDGRLVAHPGERKDWLYLLVVGSGHAYIVVGFMEGRDLMVPERWKEPPRVRYEGYFASQESLRPLAELPGDA